MKLFEGWEPQDWIGVYGAILASAIFVRELWKERRAAVTATLSPVLGYTSEDQKALGLIAVRVHLVNNRGHAVKPKNAAIVTTGGGAGGLFIDPECLPALIDAHDGAEFEVKLEPSDAFASVDDISVWLWLTTGEWVRSERLKRSTVKGIVDFAQLD